MSETNTEHSNKKISRRKFFQLAAAGAGGAALGYLTGRLGIGTTTPEATISPEIELNTSTLVLDFFDLDKAKGQYLQENFPTGFSEKESLEAMGVTDPSTKEGLLHANPQNEDHVKLLLTLLFMNEYKNHGENVDSVMKQTEKYLGVEDNKPKNRVSVAGAVKLGRVEFDEIGNPTMHVSIAADQVQKLVSQSSESVINMSLQLGDFSLTCTLYQKVRAHPDVKNGSKITMSDSDTSSYTDSNGNAITEEEYEVIEKLRDERVIVPLEPSRRSVSFEDGYAGDKTYGNLEKLAWVANKHLDKHFVVAGGNPTSWPSNMPDTREARSRLEQKGLWPNNITIAGFTFDNFQSGDTEWPASLGADIYAKTKDLEKLGFEGASSYATPEMRTIIILLIAAGLNTHRKIREGFVQMTTVEESWPQGSEKIESRILDLDKAKEILDYLQLQFKIKNAEK